MRLWILALVLFLAGCGGHPIKPVKIAIVNETPSKLTVSAVGNQTEILPFKHGEVSLINKKGQTLIIYSGGNKIRDYEMTVTPMLKGSPDDQVIVLVEPKAGAKTSLYMGDYTDLYNNGNLSPKTGKIMNWENLRNREVYRCPYPDAVISFPSEIVPQTLEKGKKLFRMVRVPLHVRATEVDNYARQLLTSTSKGKQ